MEEISKRHVGKYVCYQREDGGACWGLVKDQGFVNTRQGEKEVLILTNRYVRYERNKDVKRFRYFYPDVLTDPELRKPMQVTEDGKNLESLGDFSFFETSQVRGDTTLRLSSIDEKRDIIELDDLLDKVDKKTLFEALMAGRTIAEALDENKEKEVVSSVNRKYKGFDDIRDGGSGAFGVTAIEIGLRHLVRTDSAFEEKASKLLRERLAENFDKQGEGEGYAKED